MNLSAPIEAVLSATRDAHFSGTDYFVLILLLLISMAIGIYFGYFDGKEKTTVEYLMGGRRLKTIPVAISLVSR